MEIKDSGKRQEFTTGSVRDTDEGKGQPHLLPTEAILAFLNYNGISSHTTLATIENELLEYGIVRDTREGGFKHLINAIIHTIKYIMESTDNYYSSAMKTLAIHFQQGAKKYAKNNWRKGQPISRMYDSAMRHLWALLDSKKDEPHAAALLWNLFAIIQTKLDVEKGNLPIELNDFPFIKSEIWIKKEE